MKFVEPKVILFPHEPDLVNLQELLETVGAPDWWSDAPTSTEQMVEIAGRLCYRSFKPGLNANVTRVREGNRQYIGNLIKQKHGSVLEHGVVTVAFLNVSRVFTHELVRHRLAGYSQESLRYVRLTELSAYYPKAFRFPLLLEVAEWLDEHWASMGDKKQWAETQEEWLRSKFIEIFQLLEATQQEITGRLRLDDLGNFDLKKQLTSAMRRLAPIGLATNVIMTANHRAFRWIMEQRGSPYAEEEIEMVFRDFATQMAARFPNIYQDMSNFDRVEFGASKI